MKIISSPNVIQILEISSDLVGPMAKKNTNYADSIIFAKMIFVNMCRPLRLCSFSQFNTFFSYTKVNQDDNKWTHQLEVGWLKMENLLSDSFYQKVLSPRDQLGQMGEKNVMLRIFCSEKPPGYFVYYLSFLLSFFFFFLLFFVCFPVFRMRR